MQGCACTLHCPSASASYVLAFAPTGSGTYPIYVSYDGGATYNASGPSCSWLDMAMTPDAVIMYAPGCDALYRSSDAGQNWQALPNSPVCGRVSISADGATIAGQCSSELKISADSGATWQSFPPPVGYSWSCAELALSLDGSTVVTTIKDGSNLYACFFLRSGGGWSVWISGALPGGWWWSAEGVALSADGATVLLAGVLGNVVYSRDRGASWNVYRNSDSSWKYQSASVSSDGLVMLAVRHWPEQQQAIQWHSRDGGATWTETVRTERVPGVAAQNMPIARVSPDGKAIAYNVLLYTLPTVSLDAGTTWVAQLYIFPPDPSNMYGARGFALSSGEQSRMHACRRVRCGVGRLHCIDADDCRSQAHKTVPYIADAE